MARQEQQPLLAGPPNSSSWPCHQSPWASASPSMNPFASEASSSGYNLATQQQHGSYGTLGLHNQQQCSTQAYAAYGATAGHSPTPTQVPQHHKPIQQQQSGCIDVPSSGVDPFPYQHPSYNSSSYPAGQYGSGTGPQSSENSMHYSSSCPNSNQARRTSSCTSVDTTDMPARQYPSLDTLGTADTLQAVRGLYPSTALMQGQAAQQQQQEQQQYSQLLQQRISRYPSIDSSTTSGSSGTGRTLSMLYPYSSLGIEPGRHDSIRSSGSSSSRYPLLPGGSSNMASRLASAVSDGGPSCSLDSWQAGRQQQQQQAPQHAELVAGLQQLHCDVQTASLIAQQSHQQGVQLVQSKHMGERRSNGLYPILSGEEGGTQQQQQQQVTPAWGYDLTVALQQVSGLPAVGHPFLLIQMHLGSYEEHYRTDPQWSTQQASYGADDFLQLQNLQPHHTLCCEVWDKSLAGDSMTGRVTWSLEAHLKAHCCSTGQPVSNQHQGSPGDADAAVHDVCTASKGGCTASDGGCTACLGQQADISSDCSGRDQGLPSPAAATPAAAAAAEENCAATAGLPLAASDAAAAAAGAAGAAAELGDDVVLELQHPTKSYKQVGQLRFKVLLKPSLQEGQPCMVGPVRYRQHLCHVTGAFTGHWSTDDMAYSTFKMYLCHISSIFEGVRMPWNTAYNNAKAIFESPVVLQAVRTQHSAMYATQAGTSRGGVLRTAADFFKLFNYGTRGGEPRFYTYALCSDCFRCSETGTFLVTDFASKHAMHAGGAEEVLYAGEFCIMPSQAAAAGHKLVIDNNSGTYAPHKAKLRLLQQLFTANFKGMEVEVLDWRDPKLAYYQSLCPSRAVSAVPTAGAAAAAGRAQQQFVAG